MNYTTIFNRHLQLEYTEQERRGRYIDDIAHFTGKAFSMGTLHKLSACFDLKMSRSNA